MSIKIENVDIHGWEAAVRGARNPMNSWQNSDSKFIDSESEGDYWYHTLLYSMGFDEDDYDTINGSSSECKGYDIIGPNDHKLLMDLCKGGSEESKWRRFVHVSMDITAPEYWWAEFDTYRIGVARNSCSKMHKMLSKPFEMNDFSFDQLPGYKNKVPQFRPEYNEKDEEWREYKNTGYWFSNYGRIKHDKRELVGSLHQDGYIFVTIKGRQLPVHRCISELFIDNPDNKPVVNHKDGNKMNNSIENLEWVTVQENALHAHSNNLQPRGLTTYKGKFTDEQREEIKYLFNEKHYSKRHIALNYGVSHTCINDILNEKYRYADKVNVFETVARPIVDTLNELRDFYFRTEDEQVKKKIWYSILQLLPISYNQKASIDLNYEVLAKQYRERKNHKLDCWREYCEWIKTLPYSELITMEETDGRICTIKNEGN